METAAVRQKFESQRNIVRDSHFCGKLSGKHLRGTMLHPPPRLNGKVDTSKIAGYNSGSVYEAVLQSMSGDYAIRFQAALSQSRMHCSAEHELHILWIIKYNNDGGNYDG